MLTSNKAVYGVDGSLGTLGKRGGSSGGLTPSTQVNIPGEDPMDLDEYINVVSNVKLEQSITAFLSNLTAELSADITAALDSTEELYNIIAFVFSTSEGSGADVKRFKNCVFYPWEEIHFSLKTPGYYLYTGYTDSEGNKYYIKTLGKIENRYCVTVYSTASGNVGFNSMKIYVK